MAQFDNLITNRYTYLNIDDDPAGDLVWYYDLGIAAAWDASLGKFAFGADANPGFPIDLSGLSGTFNIIAGGGSQLLVGEDTSSYILFGVDSGGDTTITAVGSAPYIRIANDVAIGTSAFAPNNQFEIRDSGDYQLRTSYDASNYAEWGADSAGRGVVESTASALRIIQTGDTTDWTQFKVGSDGRGMWTTAPTGGSSEFQWWQMGSDTEGRGIVWLLDKNANVAWLRPDRDDDGHDLDLYFNVRFGEIFRWSINFSEVLQLDSNALDASVPGHFLYSDASTNTVLEVLRLKRDTSGTAAAGIGAGMYWLLEDAGGTTGTVATLECTLTDATAGAVDSKFEFRVQNGGSYRTDLFVVHGDQDAVGVGAGTPEGKFEVSNGATDAEQLVTLDQNDTDQPFFDFQGQASANSTDSISTWTAGNSIQGFIQVEINGTKRWIPFYDNPTS